MHHVGQCVCVVVLSYLRKKKTTISIEKATLFLAPCTLTYCILYLFFAWEAEVFWGWSILRILRLKYFIDCKDSGPGLQHHLINFESSDKNAQLASQIHPCGESFQALSSNHDTNPWVQYILLQSEHWGTKLAINLKEVVATIHKPFTPAYFHGHFTATYVSCPEEDVCGLKYLWFMCHSD